MEVLLIRKESAFRPGVLNSHYLRHIDKGKEQDTTFSHLAGSVDALYEVEADSQRLPRHLIVSLEILIWSTEYIPVPGTRMVRFCNSLSYAVDHPYNAESLLVLHHEMSSATRVDIMPSPNFMKNFLEAAFERMEHDDLMSGVSAVFNRLPFCHTLG